MSESLYYVDPSGSSSDYRRFWTPDPPSGVRIVEEEHLARPDVAIAGFGARLEEIVAAFGPLTVLRFSLRTAIRTVELARLQERAEERGMGIRPGPRVSGQDTNLVYLECSPAGNDAADYPHDSAMARGISSPQTCGALPSAVMLDEVPNPKAVAALRTYPEFGIDNLRLYIVGGAACGQVLE